MEVLTLLEHETIPVVKHRSVGDKSLSREQAKKLSRLESELPRQAFVWGHNAIKFSQYCGVISLGALTIEILPKIYGREEVPGVSREVLVRMLYRARQIKQTPGGMASVALQKHALLDLFILHFCDQLHAELMQGMIRNYVVRNENLNVLRGRLRVERQFKDNLSHKERLFCQFDELSADNDHNRIIKHVLGLLSRLAVGVQARKQLAELQMRFDGIKGVPVSIDMLDRLPFDRSTTRYEPIFEQCRWYLQGVHPDVLSGRNPCMALLFDMNRLFEAYVASELRKLAWKCGLRLREQGPQKYMIGRDDRDEELFLMKPDIAFIDTRNRVLCIADAKWKLLDEREKKLGISQADLYQMSSYASRYGVEQLMLMYPAQQWLTKPAHLRILGSRVELRVVPIDVANVAIDLDSGLLPYLEGLSER